MSLFRRANRPHDVGEGTVGTVLDGIRAGRWADPVAAVRAAGTKEERKRLKIATLPATAFSGTFRRRANGALLTPSGFVCLDFDDVEDPAALRDKLARHLDVYAAWISVSGTGVKALVRVEVVDPVTGECRLPANDAEHKAACAVVFALFPEASLDQACKDIARLCFVSHDPDLRANPDALPVTVELAPGANEVPASRAAQSVPTMGDDVPLTLGEIATLLSCLRRPAASGDYDYWLSVYANLIAFCGDNGHGAEDVRRLMESWSPSRERGDYPPGNRDLRQGQAGAFVNLLKAQGLHYRDWLRERYARLRGDETPRERRQKTQEGAAAALTKRPVLDVRPASTWMEAAALEPIPRMLWGPLWFEGETTVLFSSTNAGKSVGAVQIADGIASGFGAMGLPCEAGPTRVLYLDFEMSRKQFERRYSQDFTEPHHFHPNFLRAEIDPDALADEDHFDAAVRQAIEEAVETYDVRVVVVDNLTFIARQSQEAKDALPLMRALYRMKREHSLSLLILGHTPKRDGTRALTRNDLAGSAHVANFVDAMVGLGRSAKDPAQRYLKQIKQRSTEEVFGAEHVLVLTLEKRGSFLGLWPIGTAEEADHLAAPSSTEKMHRDSRILALREQGLSYRDIAFKLSVSKTTIQRVVKSAVEEGRLAVPDQVSHPVPLPGVGTPKSNTSDSIGVPGSPLAPMHGDGALKPPALPGTAKSSSYDCLGVPAGEKGTGWDSGTADPNPLASSSAAGVEKPPVNARVETPDGPGRVLSTIKGVRVRLDHEERQPPYGVGRYDPSEVRLLDPSTEAPF
ncbi:MAG: AAA family ATPase [Bacteroidota bacterium]